jgi:hypothetical protein
MAMSSVFVVSNALRLRGVRPALRDEGNVVDKPSMPQASPAE